jgi:peroxiredoxin
MRRSGRLIAGLLFAVASVWIHYQVKVESLRSGAGGRTQQLGNLKVGEPAPELKARDLLERDVTLSGLRGHKVVLLDFWATWCGPCRTSMPALQQLHDEFKDRGLEILSVDQGEDREQVQQFVKRKAYSFRVLLDPESEIGASFGVRAIPTQVLVDKLGAVRFIHVGASGSDEELRRLVERLTRE